MFLKLMKVLLFQKKNFFARQFFELGIQIVSLFLYTGNLGEMAIQSCAYHIVPLPRKWGFKEFPKVRVLNFPEVKKGGGNQHSVEYGEFLRGGIVFF